MQVPTSVIEPNYKISFRFQTYWNIYMSCRICLIIDGRKILVLNTHTYILIKSGNLRVVFFAEFIFFVYEGFMQEISLCMWFTFWRIFESITSFPSTKFINFHNHIRKNINYSKYMETEYIHLVSRIARWNDKYVIFVMTIQSN